MKRSEPLQRKTPLRSRSQPKKRSGFTPASKEQREKVKRLPCLECGREFYLLDIDAAHLAARAHGGCDEAECVVPLCRVCHRAFDDGLLDILPLLVQCHVPELQHALGHYNGDLIALLQRLTGQRYVPESESEAA